MTGGYMKTYALDVKTSHTPEDGAHTPSWPNRLIIILVILPHLKIPQEEP
jgi:hypothetical protein